MGKGIDSTGVPSIEELKKTPGFPSEKRLMEGPVAVIECVQEIPCNVCEEVCPFGAIEVGEPIINLPKLDEEKCRGCGKCVASCPGLAIFVVDYTFSQDEALISLPYEFLPLPNVGSIVDAADRYGRVVTKGRVVKVVDGKKFDHTAIVSIAIPKKYINEVRSIYITGKKFKQEGGKWRKRRGNQMM